MQQNKEHVDFKVIRKTQQQSLSTTRDTIWRFAVNIAAQLTGERLNFAALEDDHMGIFRRILQEEDTKEMLEKTMVIHDEAATILSECVAESLFSFVNSSEGSNKPTLDVMLNRYAEYLALEITSV